ncbi:bifunctional acetate--CoA ligase family protein/GNAT family N-acetyltransferase [Chitiniphilus purpureus]|uniref:Bifunctional acetate--CoA ligase family protein/GNAT family N-acetyltransferase n=1 Tax=Chitiniphilus purpureus TaxID=2981137 RepID=A0ABY6DJS8_9NEIS|nr:bifunctional acetate--CoA ligase family protein/GNAT family N-acetyltransferase [Chitiniphilus sp. CD1]UXY14611.1 bifunctional acetate--CoA ligase family protein/GNAT family N-acetyltransferase [Chitiniphilus sp. CD1]
MKQHYLTPLFDPKSVAVIGATETEGAVGRTVFANLVEGRYPGRLFPVNLRRDTVLGIKAVRSVAEIDGPLDLVVITTPSRTLKALIEQCGRRGVKAVVLMSCDFVGTDERARTLLDQLLVLARQYDLRLFGPTVFGLVRPISNFLAGHYQGRITAGNLALVSQSSSVASAILDWAESHEVGFSSVVSLGTGADVDVGETLDYLVSDPRTRSILIYLEDVQDARTLMSALRAAARTKPVMVLKVGRYDETLALGRTHSERLIGRDDVFEAALRRAGVLRIRSINQLFIAARVVNAGYRTRGRRLAIITNGMGAGMMAVDRAHDLNIQLPTLTPDTMAQLAVWLPAQAERCNPVDVLGDAPAARFRGVTQTVLADPNVDGVVVVFTPQVGTDHMATAEAMIELHRSTDKPILLAWIGGKKVEDSRRLLTKHNCAHFNAPEHGVEVFYSLAAWEYNQQLLLQTAAPLGEWENPDFETARIIIDTVLASGRTVLDEIESKAILRAFHIPVIPTLRAASADDAVTVAMGLGLPIALKLDVEGVAHKTDIDGVTLNIQSLVGVAAEANRMLTRARERFGDKVRGLTVQPMHGRRFGRELMLGVARDRAFGPVITFGAGGIAVEIFNDVAVALPPLNEYLAANLIRRTRVKKMLEVFRNQPAVKIDAVADVLLRLSELVCELPQVQQLDLNPLVADEQGVIAVDARIVVAPVPERTRRYAHMAIHPYPSHLVQVRELKNGIPVTIRPVRPEDAEMMARFVAELSDETRYNRYMNTLKTLPQAMLARFTQLDYAREVALVGTLGEGDGERILGVARFTVNPDYDSCEFAIVIADTMQGKGLGSQLMQALFSAARDMDLDTVEGEVLTSNKTMLNFMKRLGFEIHPHPEDEGLKWVVKRL